MSEQLSLVQVSNCTLTETGAQFDPALDFKQWLEAGKRLASISACVNWWIGDWLMFGVKSYGDRIQVAEDTAQAMGLNSETLRASLWVSEHVEDVRRITTLSWSHHREVAPLKPKDQQHWLALASENKWSVSQLRQAIRASQAESKEDGSKAAGFSVIGWATQGLRWFKQRMNDKPIEQWPAEQRSALKEGLKPIVDVYERL
jgi:hypothetical protein